MFDFCQPVVDVVCEADAVEGNDGVFFRAFAPGKLNAVIGHDLVVLVRNGLDQVFKERLTKEINTWDHRAEQFKLQSRPSRPGRVRSS